MVAADPPDRKTVVAGFERHAVMVFHQFPAPFRGLSSVRKIRVVRTENQFEKPLEGSRGSLQRLNRNREAHVSEQCLAIRFFDYALLVRIWVPIASEYAL